MRHHTIVCPPAVLHRNTAEAIAGGMAAKLPFTPQGSWNWRSLCATIMIISGYTWCFCLFCIPWVLTLVVVVVVVVVVGGVGVVVVAVVVVGVVVVVAVVVVGIDNVIGAGVDAVVGSVIPWGDAVGVLMLVLVCGFVVLAVVAVLEWLWLFLWAVIVVVVVFFLLLFVVCCRLVVVVVVVVVLLF